MEKCEKQECDFFFFFHKKNNVISLKWITEKGCFFLWIFEVFVTKHDLFKKKKSIKIDDIYKMTFDSIKFHGTNKFLAAKYSIVGNYSAQKVSL